MPEGRLEVAVRCVREHADPALERDQLGLALTPLSVFAILLLEQSRHLGLDLLNQVTAIVAIVLLLEVIGPLVTQRALIWAGEASKEKED